MKMGRILDSGQRKTFETGAVRDIQRGKGRFDLMPLHEMAGVLMERHTYLPSIIINKIGKAWDCIRSEEWKKAIHHLNWALIVFMEHRKWNYGEMFLDLAKHFEDGADKYGPRNWEKGIPFDRYIDSGVRHFLKWSAGLNDEPHDRAFVWNIICLIWTINHRNVLGYDID